VKYDVRPYNHQREKKRRENMKILFSRRKTRNAKW